MVGGNRYDDDAQEVEAARDQDPHVPAARRARRREGRPTRGTRPRPRGETVPRGSSGAQEGQKVTQKLSFGAVFGPKMGSGIGSWPFAGPAGERSQVPVPPPHFGGPHGPPWACGIAALVTGVDPQLGLVEELLRAWCPGPFVVATGRRCEDRSQSAGQNHARRRPCCRASRVTGPFSGQARRPGQVPGSDPPRHGTRAQDPAGLELSRARHSASPRVRRSKTILF